MRYTNDRSGNWPVVFTYTCFDMPSRKQTLAVALVTFTGACYSHVPLNAPVPAPATRIIAQVTDTGSVAMANSIGSAATEVEGVVSHATDALWRLQLVRVDHRGGTSTVWKREEVSFPRIALTNVREKRLSKKRSWLMATAVTASVYLATHLFGAFGSGGSTDGDPVPPQ